MLRKNFPHRKEQKKKEALERQAAYDKLTNKQRLENLEKLGLTASRERAKLLYRIAKEEESKQQQKSK